MMNLHYNAVSLTKKQPLRISRGLVTGSTNLFVSFNKGGVTGIGEMAPASTEPGATTAESAMSALKSFEDLINEEVSINEIYNLAIQNEVPPGALAALDIALWDHKAKSASMPLYTHLGLPVPSKPTSITIGISTPEEIIDRIPKLLEKDLFKSLKVKLGSNQGIEADKAMFLAVQKAAKPFGVDLRVDANGGWSVNDAKKMMQWLADRDTDYVEQPLKEGEEDGLPFLFKSRPLPIFVDESCRFSHHIPKFADSVDGVNLKLMKCGGITEALRIIATAKAFKLKTMIGCMGESNISISAAASISGLVDYIDLDSHFNLNPDPAEGSRLIDGVVLPANLPGHGAKLKDL